MVNQSYSQCNKITSVILFSVLPETGVLHNTNVTGYEESRQLFGWFQFLPRVKGWRKKNCLPRSVISKKFGLAISVLKKFHKMCYFLKKIVYQASFCVHKRLTLPWLLHPDFLVFGLITHKSIVGCQFFGLANESRPQSAARTLAQFMSAWSRQI